MHRVINKQHKVNWTMTENKAQLGLSMHFYLVLEILLPKHRELMQLHVAFTALTAIQ